MKIEDYLRMKEGIVYLRTINGVWKKFDNVVNDVLIRNVIKLKKRRFRVNDRWAWGGRLMGKDGDEIWIYERLSQDERGKILIYEIAGIHFEEQEMMKASSSNLLEKIAEIIWQDGRYQTIINSLIQLKGGVR